MRPAGGNRRPTLTRKAYVRVVYTIDEPLVEPIEVIAGVELQPNLILQYQYNELHKVLRRALSPSTLRNFSDAELTGTVEQAILRRYPEGTSYFIEVGRGKLDQYVQVYHP